MAVSRKIKREFKLDEFRDQAAEALGVIPGLEIKLENDDVVVVPHPLFLSDDMQGAVERAQRRDDEDRNEAGGPNGKIGGEPAPPFSVRLARAILGEQDHARFLEGGGSSNDVAMAWQYLTKEMQQDQGPKLPR